MSRNPFLEYQGYESKPNRNNYDRTRRNFFTGKLGCEIPVFVDEVNSGDSFQINPEFLLNFFPMPFPVQTPMRASVQFYYVKNRGLQKNWPDFLYSNKQITPPYISKPQGQFWQTGGLADYLGVPTTYSRLSNTRRGSVFAWNQFTYPSVSEPIYEPLLLPSPLGSYFGDTIVHLFGNLRASVHDEPVRNSSTYLTLLSDIPLSLDMIDTSISILPRVPLLQPSGLKVYVFTSETGLSTDAKLVAGTIDDNLGVSFKFSDTTWLISGVQGSVTGLTGFLTAFYTLFPQGQAWFAYGYPSNVATWWPSCLSELDTIPLVPGETYLSQASLVYSGASLQDLSVLDRNPFADYGSGPAVPISALPFRAYEQIHNVYSRDPRVDPFVIDGEVQYNKFVTNDGDGADSTDYHLFYRRWEPDFLTTALPSPQQGLAPLVGITVRGDMEFRNDDGSISRIRPILADDGETPTGIAGVLKNGTPEALRAAQAIITQGISINDFRNVNALQRWVENNYRRGLRYADQVLANTGVRIKYDELDLPEYLGGFSRPVQVTQITQSTPSTASDNALGDRAGQASVYGGAKHMIRRYCDEAGFIIGIFTISPQPVYTQLLPKYFLKTDPLSYYHPVFGHIGPQPITYREVCPIQCLKDGGDLDAVFGYQRPYYDLLAAVDEAHGNMRMSMRGMLMQRTFTGVPELGRDFITIDPVQLNQVFVSTDGTEDVFQGQIVFNDYVKRAIPRFGQPRIEP